MTDETGKTALEKSRDMISQLKEMRHDAEVNIKKLAELWLVLDGEMNHKAFAQRVEELSSQQTAFHEAAAALISDYEMECNRIENEAS